MKDTVKSLTFLTTMMKSIPTQVDSDFMREFKRGFKTKSIRDIAVRGGIKIKGQENKILEKSAQMAQAFIESHRIYSSKQKGGGGNSPNEIVEYNPREARLSILRHILRNPASYGSLVVATYNGMLIYLGMSELNRRLSSPIGTKVRNNGRQNTNMPNNALVIYGDNNEEIVTIDFDRLNLEPIPLLDMIIHPRETLENIGRDVAVQMDMLREDVEKDIQKKVRGEYEDRRLIFINEFIEQNGLTGDDASTFRRLAFIRNSMTGESGGRAFESLLRQMRRGTRDLYITMERDIADATRVATDRLEDVAVNWTHSIQDSSSMLLDGGFYFLSAAVFFFAARCLRRRRRRRRNRERVSSPNIEVLNNTGLNRLSYDMKNSSNQRGGRKTRRYKKKKLHKKRKKTRAKRKTHKKSKRRGRKKSHKKRR